METKNQANEQKKFKRRCEAMNWTRKKGVQRYGFKIKQKVMEMTLKRNKGY